MFCCCSLRGGPRNLLPAAHNWLHRPGHCLSAALIGRHRQGGSGELSMVIGQGGSGELSLVIGQGGSGELSLVVIVKVVQVSAHWFLVRVVQLSKSVKKSYFE